MPTGTADPFILSIFAWGLLGLGNIYYGIAQRAIKTGPAIRLDLLFQGGSDLLFAPRSELHGDSLGGVFEVDARVMRSIPYDPTSIDAAGMGLQFLDLDGEQRKIVVDLIHDLQDRAAQFKGELDPYLGVFLPSVDSSKHVTATNDPPKKPGEG